MKNETVWPEKLCIRDTGIHDDLGGAGQRIYTTAGQGYEKKDYICVDALHSKIGVGRSNEQELIDIMFEIADASVRHYGREYPNGYTSKQAHMDWVARQLRECGFDTKPLGASWGVLQQKENDMS